MDIGCVYAQSEVTRVWACAGLGHLTTTLIPDMTTLNDDAALTLDAQQRNLPTHACSLLSLIAVLTNDTDMCAPERFLASGGLDLWKPTI